MVVYWRVFVDCKASASASSLSSKLFKLVSRTPTSVAVEPYHKGGHVITATITLVETSWPNCVLEALSLSQKVARGWSITGNIEEELDAWSNESSVSGVTSVQVQLARASA